MDDRNKVVVFGLGKVYRKFMELVDESKIEIIALSDNSIELQGKVVSGKTVKNPEEIPGLNLDYVIVTSTFYESIKNQLVAMGIPAESILNFYEIYKDLSQSRGRDNLVVNFMKENISLEMAVGGGLDELKALQEKNLFLNAGNYVCLTCDKRLDSLEDAEFQVYSQFGEDGIIQWLIHNVEIREKTFIEFGVEDYTEANTRFLLMNNNWSGLVMDGSEENIASLKNWKQLWKYDLSAVAEFITQDNINQLITNMGFSGDIGILSIDLDGNDYWILNAIDCVKPRILICEYNNIFGSREIVSVPYDPAFVRTQKHYSNLYWGASLGAFCDWARKNHYYYMGSNSAGNNAFFVREDCINADLIPAKAEDFVESKYRESRGKRGELTYLRGDKRLECIKEMELVNLKTKQIDTIANIYRL